MKIFLTGATGFVGAHTARALLEAGHELRLLVRNRQAAESYFHKYGLFISEYVVSDMLEKDAVKKGMTGCDAVVHAAAVVDLNARNAEKTQSINFQGIDSVIGSACELGIKKILYVSSMSALVNTGKKVIDEQSPLADVHDAYSKSKKMCEEKVRELQVKGYPIIITYPSGVFGPDDPKMSESNAAFLKFIKLLVPLTTSGIQYVDVRDVAKAHVLLLEKPLAENIENERYLLTGHFTPWREFAHRLEAASGITIRKIPVSGATFRFIGALLDGLRQLFPISFPLSVEAARLVTQMPGFDSSRLLKTVAMQYRTPEETFMDTVSWLRKEKYLDK